MTITDIQPEMFTSVQVCRQAGVSYRQLDHWVLQRYLQPAQPGGEGSGYGRIWSRAELDRAVMMARLVLLGVSAQRAAMITRNEDERRQWLADVLAATKRQS